MNFTRWIPGLVLLLSGGTGTSSARAQSDRDAILSAMRKAASYFHSEVSRHGGYVYYTSPDFSRRLGEGAAAPDQIWVQPPATPTVGLAYLSALEATKEPIYLEAARDAAKALVYGQLASGGWTNSIDFEAGSDRAGKYRDGRGNGKGKDFSTLDDGITQGALQFLMRYDEATKFSEPEIHEAVEFALDALLRAQFPNGGVPQGWDDSLRTPNPTGAERARFPDYDWRTEGRIKEFWDYYQLNDGIAPSLVETLITAHRIYEREDCLSALHRFGEFLIAAQMPDPQPAWAQQYNDDLEPIWARAFEPPAIAGRESEGVIVALLRIAVHLRDARFLQPIPAALRYLEDSQLPGGELARYYEMETNRPLYMQRNGKAYELTYDDSRLPSHYGWKNPSRVAELQKAYSGVIDRKPLPDPILPPQEPVPSVGAVLRDLDEEGRWISRFAGERLVGQPKFAEGEPYLSSEVFARNLTLLSEAVRE